MKLNTIILHVRRLILPIILCLGICASGQTPQPTHYVVGIAPCLYGDDFTNVFTAGLTFVLEGAAPGDRVSFQEGVGLREFAAFDIPLGKQFESNSAARARRLASEIAQFKRAFIDTIKPATAPPGRLELAKLLDYAGTHLKREGQNVRVILIGNPHFRSNPTEVPAEESLTAASSMLSAHGRETALTGVALHVCYLHDEVFSSRANYYNASRFLAKFCESRGGVLSTFTPSIKVAFDRARRGETAPFIHNATGLVDEVIPTVAQVAPIRASEKPLRTRKAEVPANVPRHAEAVQSPAQLSGAHSNALPLITIAPESPNPRTPISAEIKTFETPSTSSGGFLPEVAKETVQSATDSSQGNDVAKPLPPALSEKPHEGTVVVSAINGRGSEWQPLESALKEPGRSENMFILITWTHGDLDLYVRPEPTAEELQFRMPNTARGRLFASSGKTTYEWCEIYAPANLRSVRVFVNFEKGWTANAGGTASIYYQGQTFSAPFAFKASLGNHGKDTGSRNKSRAWVELDISSIVGGTPTTALTR